MLSVNNIEVIYDHVILVLKGVSLGVPQGKIVTLLGANGAGKTTTLKAVSNLLGAERGDVTKGSIEFNGKRVDKLTPSDLVRMGVVQVMEGRHCFGHLTVEENLLTGAFTRSVGRAELKRDLELVYTYFHRLKERRNSLAGYTSGGEQQMTAIGRALMAQPKMILLDEPSMGFAPQLVEEIFEIVKNLNQKEKVSFLLAELETRDPRQREREQFAALRRQVAHAQENAPYFARLLAGVNPGDIKDRAALAQLPVTRKSDVTELQQAHPPFAQMVTQPTGGLSHVFMSPGPIFDPESGRTDYWRFARAMYAAGFRKGELVYNTFSYHFTPAGFMADLGAQAIGCAVFPGGIGQTEMQVAAIAALRPQCYVGTPSFLKIILKKADELKADVSSIQNALVSAEALPRSLRASLGERGVKTLQCYAIGDLGLLAYESPALEGMIVDEGVIVEIVRPGTGDLSAVLAGASPCGRTNMRIKGWMGRADQTTKVKGMFVKPSQVAEVAKRHPEIRRYRLKVDHDEKKDDRMTFSCEVNGGGGDALAQAIAASIRAVCNLRGEVAFKPLGSLPNDGKVIDDTRKYD